MQIPTWLDFDRLESERSCWLTELHVDCCLDIWECFALYYADPLLSNSLKLNQTCRKKIIGQYKTGFLSLCCQWQQCKQGCSAANSPVLCYCLKYVHWSGEDESQNTNLWLFVPLKQVMKFFTLVSSIKSCSKQG